MFLTVFIKGVFKPIVCLLWLESVDEFVNLERSHIYMLQFALVLDSSSSIPDGDGAGEDELDDGSVEVNHHSL